MPQGTIKVIRPLGSDKDKDKPKGCEGEVTIESGEHAGEIGYFNQEEKDCCKKQKGDPVEINIIREEKDGRIIVEMTKC